MLGYHSKEYDLNGSIIDHSFLSFTIGAHSYVYIPKASIAAGIYLLKLTYASNHQMVMKIVKE